MPASNPETSIATSEPVEACRRAFQLCQDMDGESRTMSYEDLEFAHVEQWDGESRRARDLEGRPCMTVNTLPATINLVVNDIRQNRQSIHVHPVGNGANDEVAEIIEGLLRHIEYDSGADAAYDTAVNCAVSSGFGFFRLVSEYCDNKSHNQKLVIKRVRNPFTIQIDPMSQEADGSDMRFAIVSVRMQRADFMREYPDAETGNDQLGIGVGDTTWFSSDEVRVAEFYRVEETPATLELYSDGSTRFAGDKAPLQFGVHKVKTRASVRRKIMWYKLTGSEVLESVEIPCKWIPIFPVYGSEVDIDGRVFRTGIVHWAKDPSAMYNYFLTSATEEVALRTKTPFIGAAGFMEGYENDWAQANNRSFAALEYNPVNIEGVLAPPPQRQPMADIPAGNLQMTALARDNIKATTGIYDASLGARSNETSGRGIVARQRQGDIANFHFSDNFSRAIRHLGRCAMSFIPEIYDKERVERIMGEDGKSKLQAVNTPNHDGQRDKNGAVQRVLNDLTVGEYDVVVSSGPSYSTLRQEASDSMVEFVRSWPDLMGIAGDKVIRAMAWPGAEDMADRVADKLGIKDEEETAEPQVQTQHGPMSVEEAGKTIAQMEQVLDQTHARMSELESGIAKSRVDAESRERVAEINAASRHDDTELKGMITLMIARMDANEARTAAAITAADTQSHMAAQAGHDAELADQSHQHATEQAAQQSEPAEPTAAPEPGAIEDGHVFKGGDPSDPASWEPQQ